MNLNSPHIKGKGNERGRKRETEREKRETGKERKGESDIARYAFIVYIVIDLCS